MGRTIDETLFLFLCFLVPRITDVVTSALLPLGKHRYFSVRTGTVTKSDFFFFLFLAYLVAFSPPLFYGWEAFV